MANKRPFGNSNSGNALSKKAKNEPDFDTFQRPPPAATYNGRASEYSKTTIKNWRIT
jgi:hypothetical protein